MFNCSCFYTENGVALSSEIRVKDEPLIHALEYDQVCYAFIHTHEYSSEYILSIYWYTLPIYCYNRATAEVDAAQKPEKTSLAELHYAQGSPQLHDGSRFTFSCISFCFILVFLSTFIFLSSINNNLYYTRRPKRLGVIFHVN